MRSSIAAMCLAFSSVVLAYPIDDTAGLGRIFDGIGGLSGGGATSKLLVNYPDQQRNEILDYLFKPSFGASLHILKVEIGGDSQSTEGTEASHMHNAWDENYHRGYEWWLMVEAKKRNPDILLYCLPWTFPGWVANGTNSPYTYPQLTATYMAKWVLGAKKYYNLTIDFIGIWNERDYDSKYIQVLRNVLDASGLSHVKIVAADNDWSIADGVLSDPALAQAVSILGAHYPGTYTTPGSLKTGKQLWASEDYSTVNDIVGAGCWARILNQNYVKGFMTSTIAWNLIASYYNDLPYGLDGLMTANEPWGGHYDVSPPIWLTAHTTQFTKPGWVYLNHTTGGVGLLSKGGSYVSLVSPDKKDLTIIIETLTHDMSICIRPALRPYSISVQDIVFDFGGSLKALSQLHAWSSQLKSSYNDADIFKYIGVVNIINGVLTLASVPPDSVITLTTLAAGQKGSYGVPPPSQPFPLPYTEDFNSFPLYSEPFNFVPQIGSFEIVQSSEEHKHHRILTQTVLQAPVDWCIPRPSPTPYGVIGNYSWTDIRMSLEVRVEDVNGTDGIFLALKVDRGGCDALNALGKFFWLFPAQGRFVVSNDLAMKQVATSGTLTGVAVGDWHLITLASYGANLEGYVDGNLVFASNLSSQAPFHGFAAFGTSSFGYASFDNLEIK